MCYSHLDHSPNMKLHETEARARELAAGMAEDRRAFGALVAALRQGLSGLRKLGGVVGATHRQA